MTAEGELTTLPSLPGEPYGIGVEGVEVDGDIVVSVDSCELPARGEFLSCARFVSSQLLVLAEGADAWREIELPGWVVDGLLPQRPGVDSAIAVEVVGDHEGRVILRGDGANLRRYVWFEPASGAFARYNETGIGTTCLLDSGQLFVKELVPLDPGVSRGANQPDIAGVRFHVYSGDGTSRSGPAIPAGDIGLESAGAGEGVVSCPPGADPVVHMEAGYQRELVGEVDLDSLTLTQVYDLADRVEGLSDSEGGVRVHTNLPDGSRLISARLDDGEVVRLIHHPDGSLTSADGLENARGTLTAVGEGFVAVDTEGEINVYP